MPTEAAGGHWLPLAISDRHRRSMAPCGGRPRLSVTRPLIANGQGGTTMVANGRQWRAMIVDGRRCVPMPTHDGPSSPMAGGASTGGTWQPSPTDGHRCPPTAPACDRREPVEVIGRRCRGSPAMRCQRQPLITVGCHSLPQPMKSNHCYRFK